ncbi:hypothetical protein EVAR_43488_1 [Eumeta japonica]|uniref:Uncharacterized protein n=1 Tax=Eumeta variegata TaxID=151549 RepID=A0A4C1YL38_EUMVA|nr:hypothetical protein EVAR_43488_1 [Eumeta japonica]
MVCERARGRRGTVSGRRPRRPRAPRRSRNNAIGAPLSSVLATFTAIVSPPARNLRADRSLSGFIATAVPTDSTLVFPFNSNRQAISSRECIYSPGRARSSGRRVLRATVEFQTVAAGRLTCLTRPLCSFAYDF